MGVFDIFKKKYDSTQTVKILLYLAKSDGEISDDEIDFISRVSVELGLTFEEAKALITNVLSTPFEKAKIVFPKKESDIKNLLILLVSLMITDGKIYLSEFLFCQKIALQLNKNINIIDDILKPFIYGDKLEGYDSFKNKLKEDYELMKSKMWTGPNKSYATSEEKTLTDTTIVLLDKYLDRIPYGIVYDIGVKCYEMGVERAGGESFSEGLYWKDISKLEEGMLPPSPHLITDLMKVLIATTLIKEAVIQLNGKIDILKNDWEDLSLEWKQKVVHNLLDGTIDFVSKEV